MRIRDIGTVVERFAPPTIERKDRERINTVQGVIAGESMDKVVAGTRNRLLKWIFRRGNNQVGWFL